MHDIVRTCDAFISGMPVKDSKDIYKEYNPLNKLKRCLENWKGASKDTKITDKEYGEIIHKYDRPDTFFFLDPPYENKNKNFGYAEDTGFNFERLAALVRLLKGKFLMEINDSPNIRNLFNGFNIRPWKVKALFRIAKEKDRKELLISNYP